MLWEGKVIMPRLIDADALKKELEVWVVAINHPQFYNREEALYIIDSAPTADAVPVVRGEWMPVYESEMTGWNPAVAGRDPIGGYICSACKEEAVYDCNDKFVLSNYCPNCGAKMDGERKDGNSK